MKDKYTKEFIREKLSTNQVWLEKGVLALYRMQTEEEKSAGLTYQQNGCGFNAVDGKFLTYIAQYLLTGKHLTGKFLEDTRRRTLKYSGQLARIANEKLD